MTPQGFQIGYDRGIGFLAGGFSWEYLTSITQKEVDQKKVESKDYHDPESFSAFIMNNIKVDIERNWDKNTQQGRFIRAKFST